MFSLPCECVSAMPFVLLYSKRFTQCCCCCCRLEHANTDAATQFSAKMVTTRCSSQPSIECKRISRRIRNAERKVQPATYCGMKTFAQRACAIVRHIAETGQMESNFNRINDQNGLSLIQPNGCKHRTNAMETDSKRMNGTRETEKKCGEQETTLFEVESDSRSKSRVIRKLSCGCWIFEAPTTERWTCTRNWMLSEPIAPNENGSEKCRIVRCENIQKQLVNCDIEQMRWQ